MDGKDIKKRPPGYVRIVAGSKRGRRLKVPPGSIRPTSEAVREAVFAVLGPVLGLRVLDLFAGSGAMGLEALSRGAEHCVFVEADPRVATTLQENIASLGYAGNSDVMVVHYGIALSAFLKQARRFDLLFVDPPYRMLPEVEEALTPVVASLVSSKGLVVIESSRSLHPTLGGISLFDRVYGDTRITMITFRRKDG